MKGTCSRDHQLRMPESMLVPCSKVSIPIIHLKQSHLRQILSRCFSSLKNVRSKKITFPWSQFSLIIRSPFLGQISCYREIKQWQRREKRSLEAQWFRRLLKVSNRSLKIMKMRNDCVWISLTSFNILLLVYNPVKIFWQRCDWLNNSGRRQKPDWLNNWRACPDLLLDIFLTEIPTNFTF